MATARSSALIQAEIDRLETFLSGAGTTIASTTSDGTSVTMINRQQAEKRLKELYRDLARANGQKRFTRGSVTGLR